MPSLEQPQDVTGSAQDDVGESGEPPDLDPVGPVGAAGLQLMEEEHLFPDLAHGHVIVADGY